jgi:phospholipid/cholesterol/gamma-HCH transport system permease protein
MLGKRALVAPLACRDAEPRLVPAFTREADALFLQGLPLVGLVHVGLGSLLSMQAYFGAVLPESNGAVVGLGLFRNAAPLLTGFTLTGLIAARLATDFGGEMSRGLDESSLPAPSRGPRIAQSSPASQSPDLGRVVFVKIAAAMAVGPVLSLWGAVVGHLIGCLISRVMLGVASGHYFGLFIEMLRARDAVGIVAKGMIYPGLASLVVCHEVVRARDRQNVRDAAVRAAVYAFAAILACNVTWFWLVYVAGPPLGVPVVAAQGV